MDRVSSPFIRYGASVAAFAIVVGASSAIRRVWGISVDTTALIILVMIASAWYAGLGPGLLVAALFEGVLDYYAGWSRAPLRFAILSFNRLLLFTSVVVFASARRTAEERLKRQQETLRETLDRERAARSEAEEASRLRDEFIATVSHELRTPLNGILGWSAILNRHDVDAATKAQALRTIERSALAQARIVEDILDFSGMVRGQLRIDPRPVAFAPLIRDAIDTIAASAALKQVAIETHIEEDQVILRRRRSRAADHLEPAVERPQIHARGRRNYRAAAPCREPRRTAGRRYRHRHRSGVPAARVRSVPAGRLHVHA